MTDLRILSRLSAALLLGVALAGSPALADKGGGGHAEHGNSGGHGGGKQNASDQSGHGTSGSHMKSDNADDDDDDDAGAIDDGTTDDSTSTGASMAGQAARAAGKLNGFLHASPRSIAKASSNSALGKVRDGYGALLGAYLDPAAATKPTAADLAAALEAASNKPVTAYIIAKVNAKLMKIDPALSTNLGTMTPEQLAAEIAAAL